MVQQTATPAVSEWVAGKIESPVFRALLKRLEDGGALPRAIVPPAAQPFLAALVSVAFPQRIVVLVADTLKTQESFQQDVETWLRLFSQKSPAEKQAVANAGSGTLFYPSWEILPHESKLPHADVISERLETIVAFSANSAPRIVLAGVAALLQPTFSPAALKLRTRTLRRGDRVEPLDLVEWLEENGYEPEAQVTQRGEITLRGGILDIYPMTSPWPVRLEFFGDELESLRYFDPFSQVSREEITETTLPPGGELGILKRSRQPNNDGKQTAPVEMSTLADYLPKDTLFILANPESLEEQAALYSKQVPAGDAFFVTWHQFLERVEEKKMAIFEVAENEEPSLEYSELPPIAEDEATTLAGPGAGNESLEEIQDSPTRVLEMGFTSLETFRPLGNRAPEPAIADAQRREFFAQLHRWLRQAYDVQIVCNNEGESQRFREIWRDYGFDDSQTLPIHHGALGRGFVHEPSRTVVVTDAEIFGRYRIQRPRRLKSPHAQATRSALDIDFTEFEEGDYVVHLQHGIGKFLRLKMLPASTAKSDGEKKATETGQECLVIEYAASDSSQSAPKLYVPVTEAHLVSKYVGAGRARPTLNTLSGTRWAKAKSQAEKAVRDIASELLAIQAARESQPGHAFKADTPWQREFEGAFLYEETRDQIKAIEQTKADMERAKPMDRLICGDVGFGKTEVAIRAAFKAVMDGRQVAILVPTTVLAQQHFNTFRERMADYPIRVELLSRLRSPKECKKVLAELPQGMVDIVIGTHRLLQKDVSFKDLGLVVIDEEQRFGVMHKEKFKLLRKLVDVLTLSATPIPRTLYLALSGARDMSTIETPPQDRLPVETIVAQYDERLIRDAIRREINRGGQVFFLHNRVNTIDTVAQKLRALLPDARFVVGHGQMDPHDLEEVMASFVNGEADVLVSTTIIESGLDIPNANTIIIDRADRFGLSELYQLRGRVGRYKHQAFAYLLLARHAGLLADARKRISAIKQYSSLGSGFKIAMRDLEIRGAGNMLGPEQSGQITAVGFDLYCQLLKQSVSALKGEKVKRRVEVQVRFDFLALNPGEETSAEDTIRAKAKSKPAKNDFEISIPREVATYMASEEHREKLEETVVYKVPAYIPMAYVQEATHRIEVYRKLAQATDKESLQALQAELRDRFGVLPPPIELLLQLAELKIIASDKDITVMEVKIDKLMLTRNNDFITLDGKFPRLKQVDAKGKLKEIKKLLLAL